MCEVSYLMLIRYWAKATDSALPVMVMVLSRFPPPPPPAPPPATELPLMADSRSSQLDIRIIAPLSCLKKTSKVGHKNHKYQSSAVYRTCFVSKGTPNTNSKEHSVRFKEKQNISSQILTRNLSHFYTSFLYFW